MPIATGLGASRGLAAGIYWGPAFDKVLRFGFPMLDVRTYPVSRSGAETTRATIGGAADGWTYGSDFLLGFKLPAIPPVDAVNPYGYGDASGWDSADGWADFLAYGRRKNTLRLAPELAAYDPDDTTTYLAVKLREPWGESPGAGWSTYREMSVVLRVMAGTPVRGY